MFRYRKQKKSIYDHIITRMSDSGTEIGRGATVKAIQSTILYNKYKDLISFNKNIIIAGVCSFFSAAFFTQLYYTYYSKSIVLINLVIIRVVKLFRT